MYLFSASIELDQFQINCHKPNKVLLSVNKGHNAKNTLGWILGQALVHQLLKQKFVKGKNSYANNLIPSHSDKPEVQQIETRQEQNPGARVFHLSPIASQCNKFSEKTIRPPRSKTERGLGCIS